jgi:hypothetical protein
MKDETYLFISDCRDKKNTARSARNKRTHNGKGGRVKFPSDYMTKKELNAMNGEVRSYRLNEPMSWKEFKAMPDDIKVTYIKLLREKYGVSDTNIGKMMGASQAPMQREVKRLGISLGKGHFQRKFDKEGWLAWVNGVPTAATEEVTEEHLEVTIEEPVEEPVEETEAEPVIDVKEDHTEIRKAIPNTGNMVFEGKVEDVMNSVTALLGGAYVHIRITWDVLDEE